MLKDKASRSKVQPSVNRDKFTVKKQELAAHTIKTLAKLGYAKTSLRDIADESDVSVGVLHYYFKDKADLISYCVQMYKDNFLNRLDKSLNADEAPETIVGNLVSNVVETVRNDAEVHRLWYDIRSQAMFDNHFKAVIEELEQALIDFQTRFLEKIQLSGMSAEDYYLNVDARFRFYLQKYLNGDMAAPDDLGVSLQKHFQMLLKLSDVKNDYC